MFAIKLPIILSASLDQSLYVYICVYVCISSNILQRPIGLLHNKKKSLSETVRNIHKKKETHCFLHHFGTLEHFFFPVLEFSFEREYDSLKMHKEFSFHESTYRKRRVSERRSYSSD